MPEIPWKEPIRLIRKRAGRRARGSATRRVPGGIRWGSVALLAVLVAGCWDRLPPEEAEALLTEHFATYAPTYFGEGGTRLVVDRVLVPTRERREVRFAPAPPTGVQWWNSASASIHKREGEWIILRYGDDAIAVLAQAILWERMQSRADSQPDARELEALQDTLRALVEEQGGVLLEWGGRRYER